MNGKVPADKLFEIRTRLTGILGHLELALQLPEREEVNENIVLALREVKRLADELSSHPGQQPPADSRTGESAGTTPTAPSQPRESIPYRALSGPLRILVAEDNPVNQNILTKILTRRGHTVTAVDNGRRAVNLAAQEKFDVILMDIRMPILDGIGAIQQIRLAQTRENRRVPILVITALGSDAQAEFLHETDGIITKPFDVNQLLAAIDTAVAR